MVLANGASIFTAVCSSSSSSVCDADHVGRGYIRIGGKLSGCHFLVSCTGGRRRVLVARARAALPGFCGRWPSTGSTVLAAGLPVVLWVVSVDADRGRGRGRQWPSPSLVAVWLGGPDKRAVHG